MMLSFGVRAAGERLREPAAVPRLNPSRGLLVSLSAGNRPRPCQGPARRSSVVFDRPGRQAGPLAVIMSIPSLLRPTQCQSLESLGPGL